MKVLESHRCFEGKVEFWQHDSPATGTSMKFSTFTPKKTPAGALIWLSGLTCTEENFMIKAGAQKYLTQLGLFLICPDTSPRGLNLPREHEASDFGSGAGFYLDATTEGYRDHYRMYRYVTEELHQLLLQHFQLPSDKISLFGHSMGGHGALVIGLRNPQKYRSISAFAPIVNPSQSPWGQKAFRGYLGEDSETWKDYDACELLRRGERHPESILIDQGLSDGFLEPQRLTRPFEATCKETGQKCQVHYREGYDHSYYFIASFIESHIRYHAEAMQK